MNKIFALLLVILLTTVEASLQPSIVWNRSDAWWTPWLYKAGFLSIADIIIIALSAYVLFKILLRFVIAKSSYICLCLLACVYLYIGLIYNIWVFTFWKTYLFDIKVVLYLMVPYLFLSSVNQNVSMTGLFTPERLFIYAAIASLIDFVIVNVFGQSEFPKYLGFSAIPSLIPLSVTLVGIIYSKKFKYKFVFLSLMFFELLNAVNRIALGYLFQSMVTIFYITILRINMRFKARFAALLSAVFIINFSIVVLIYHPINVSLLAQKTGGFLTRQIQMDNALENFWHNIPGFIGKGLGSTWFEYYKIPEADIYSVGTSVGHTVEDAMDMPVKFIFNSIPPSLLHKWGILGGILLVFLITRYFHVQRQKIRQLKEDGVNENQIQYISAILLISTLFILDSFIYIGVLKTSLITSLLAFYAENNINHLRVSSELPG
jgi:hypothetical protein